MSSPLSRSSPLLALSTELRLDIYLHLVLSCVSSGIPAALSGLFLSCRTTHRELSSEFRPKLQTLLRAQHSWRQHTLHHAEARQLPLRLHHSHQHFTTAHPANLTITLPILRTWLFQNQMCYGNVDAVLHSDPIFRSLVASLVPVMSLPWHVLTLNFCKMAYAPKVSFILTHAIAEPLFTCLARMGFTGNSPVLEKVERLVLDFGSARDPVSESQFHVLFRDFFDIPRAVGSYTAMPQPLRGWIVRTTEGAKEELGWKIVFDFKDGLERGQGALWEIEKGETLWAAKRLFKADLDEVLAREVWEGCYDTDGKARESESEDDDDDDDEADFDSEELDEEDDEEEG